MESLAPPPRPRVAIGVAVLLACACVGAVIASYDSLPAVLPVTRWTSAGKSPTVAVRVPLINVLTTIGLAAIWTAFEPAGFPRAAGLTVMAAAVMKSIGEAVELLMLPEETWALTAPIATSVVAAIAVAATTSRCWLRGRGWRSARWTPLRTTIVIGALVGIVGLNVVAAI